MVWKGKKIRYIVYASLIVFSFAQISLKSQEIRSEPAVIDLSEGNKVLGFSKSNETDNSEAIGTESNFYGLIIGVSHYMDPAIQSLDNPVDDAQDLYDVLVSKYTFESQYIRILKDPKRDDIIYALDYLARVVGPNDNLLVFYAGHGWWDPDSEVGFWLPSDARKISSANWFRNSTLVDYLKSIHSRHTLLITDACFGGSIFKTRKAFLDAPRDIAILYEYPSRKAITSGNLTEVPDNSKFTGFLLDRLERNKKDFLSAQELFNSFRTAVINNSDAIPQYGEIRNVGDQGGDFIFISK